MKLDLDSIDLTSLTKADLGSILFSSSDLASPKPATWLTHFSKSLPKVWRPARK
jgi:hypothetical protein